MSIKDIEKILEGTFYDPKDKKYWEEKLEEEKIKEERGKNNEEYFKKMAVYDR